MTKAELIKLLGPYSGDIQVMIRDHRDIPREINLEPTSRIVTQEHADDVVDCEGLVGEAVVLIGYGNY